MKKITILILFVTTFGYSQTTDTIKKSNPILYLDLAIGFGRTNKVATFAGISLNYQVGKNLFTARFTEAAAIDGFFFIFPITNTVITDRGLLYGLRFIDDGESYSFSAGISRVNKSEYVNSTTQVESSFFGVPFELNYTYFNKNRARYRILYGLIPNGRPTAFGRSIGFKFYGTISKSPVFGIGISTSIGWHKRY